MPIINSPAAWLIVALLAIIACVGLAAPVLDSGDLAVIKEQDNNEKQPVGDLNEVSQALIEPQSKTSNSAEKLKRGLTNFMNQMNPAPFFIPILPQQHTNNDSKSASKAAAAASNGAQSSSKPVAIVSEDATAEALIKRPNRLGQTRPFGPMRFG